MRQPALNLNFEDSYHNKSYFFILVFASLIMIMLIGTTTSKNCPFGPPNKQVGHPWFTALCIFTDEVQTIEVNVCLSLLNTVFMHNTCNAYAYYTVFQEK